MMKRDYSGFVQYSPLSFIIFFYDSLILLKN